MLKVAELRKALCKTEQEMIESRKLIGENLASGINSSEAAAWSLATIKAARGGTVEVQVQGLTNKVQYNGSKGLLLGACNKRVDKWIVYVGGTDESDGKILAVGKQNITLVSSGTNNCPYGYKKCASCSRDASMKCKVCEVKFGRCVFYCGKECQTADWPKHKQYHEETAKLLELLLKPIVEKETESTSPKWEASYKGHALGYTPLMMASMSGNSKKVQKLLLREPSNLLAVDAMGLSALAHAVSTNQVKCVEILLTHSPPMIFSPGGIFGKALDIAMRADQTDIAEALLRGCPRELLSAPMLPGNRKGDPPLPAIFMACQFKRTKVAQLLLELGGEAVAHSASHLGCSTLWIASQSGDAGIVRSLIHAGGRRLVLQARPDTGSTPLHQACQEGHLDVVRALLEAGGEELLLARKRGDGLTCLHMASQEAHRDTVEIVRALVAAAGGARLIGLRTASGETCLMTTMQSALREELLGVLLPLADPATVAAECDGATVLDIATALCLPRLIAAIQQRGGAHGSAMRAVAAASSSPTLAPGPLPGEAERADLMAAAAGIGRRLCAACEAGRLAAVEAELRALGCVPVHVLPGADGGHALHAASRGGHAAVVGALVRHSPQSAHVPREADGVTCLYVACEVGSLPVVEALVAAGGARLLLAADKAGRSCLSVACEMGRLDVVTALLRAGGSELLHLRWRDGTTCLYMACQNGHEEVAELLLRAGGRPLALLTDEEGRTALHAACASGRPGMVRALLAAGGEELLLREDSDGRTCLHSACERGGADVVRLLLAADGGRRLLPRAARGSGFTCLHAAALRGDAEVVRVLADAGGTALLHQRAAMGHTALHMACQEGHAEAARALVAAGGERLVLAATAQGATCLHAACAPGPAGGRTTSGHVAAVRVVCEALGMDAASAAEWELLCRTRMAKPPRRQWGGWDPRRRQRVADREPRGGDGPEDDGEWGDDGDWGDADSEEDEEGDEEGDEDGDEEEDGEDEDKPAAKGSK